MKKYNKGLKVTVSDEAIKRMAKSICYEFPQRLAEIQKIIRTKTLGQEFTLEELEQVIRDITDELYGHHKAPETSE